MRQQKDLETELFWIGLTALAAAAALAVLYQYILRNILPPGYCLFDKYLGIYCPGCGGTRALYALLHGHFLKALWYHPFVPYFAVVYLGFLLSQGLQRLGMKSIRGWRFHYWYLWVGAFILAANWIVKNILRLGFSIMM